MSACRYDPADADISHPWRAMYLEIETQFADRYI